MPTVTSGQVRSLNSVGTLFDGVVVLSPTDAGCGSASECLAVSFVLGLPTAAWSRNRHSGQLMPLALPLSIVAGRWYLKQVPGVPGVILCDFANIGTAMTHTFVVAGNTSWTQIFNGVAELPAVDSIDPGQFIGLWAENQDLRSRLTNCAENYQRAMARVAVLEAQNADYQTRVPEIGTAAALMETLVFRSDTDCNG